MRYSTLVRIGLIVYGELELVSGGNLYDSKLVEHLRERDHRVDVISAAAGSYVRHLAQNLSPALQRSLNGEFDVLLQDELVHPSLFWMNRSRRTTTST